MVKFTGGTVAAVLLVVTFQNEVTAFAGLKSKAHHVASLKMVRG
jgi:hypothetical protein